VGERGELARGERLGDRDERQQPVLQPLLFLRRGGPGEELEPAVDLERVGGDRDRVLPVRAQARGDLDRHGRLAHAGRAEDRYQRFRGGHDR
jgi:hypothetical protein